MAQLGKRAETPPSDKAARDTLYRPVVLLAQRMLLFSHHFGAIGQDAMMNDEQV